MTYIKSFSVTGLAGRKGTVKRSINRDANIFWGFNGCGKTSLLKILHSALSNNPSILVRVPFKSASVTFYSTTYETDFTRKITKSAILEAHHVGIHKKSEIAQLPVLESGDFGWETTTRKEDVPEGARGLRFQHTYLSINRINDSSKRLMYAPRRELGPSALDEETLDELFASQIRQIWQNYNTNSLTEIRDVQEKGLALTLSSVLGGSEKLLKEGVPSMDSKQAYDLVRDFFADQRLRRHLKLGTYASFAKNYERDPLLRTVVSEISEVQQEIEAALEPQLKIQQLVREMYGGGKELTFNRGQLEIKSNGEEISIELLSGGEKQLLRLLLECLASEESTLLVDEPELSLHVDWQHRLIEAMQVVNPRAQLIMATHSPDIMADLPEDRIFPL
ncbi:AAA family ATPase [Streptomyces griseorubiginosus]|uniref:AAA family ATPase n=1 Tax=Streptomyces griseorubiginosus TaxID=67304 RepID=UPI0033CA9296